MRIGSKLILHTVLVAFFAVLLTAGFIGWATYFVGKRALEKDASEHLISLREAKKEEIERYFESIQNQLTIYASNLMTIKAMEEFKTAYKTYKSESNAKKTKFDINKIQAFLNEFVFEYKKENGQDSKPDTQKLLNFNNESSFLLQYNYIIDNPNPLGKKYLLDTVNDGTQYSAIHQKYHPQFREFLEKFGFYDIFLVDADTLDVIYTVFKEVDFASSLKNGVSADTALSKAVNDALATTKKGETSIKDFEPYLASYNEEAAFIATPIYDKDNVKIGILVFQFPVKVINDIMTYEQQWEEVGLEKTGETYLVGSDYFLRSMSRFFLEDPNQYLAIINQLHLPESTLQMIKDKKTTIGLQPVVTEGTKAVFETKKSGTGIFPDYRNISVLSAYTPVDIPGLNWALMSEMDVSEAFAPVYTLAKNIMWITLVIAILAVFISIVIGVKLNNTISVPIIHLNETIRKIASEMDLTKKVPVTSLDEIGEVSVALNYLIETFREALQETLVSTERMQLAGEELRSISETEDLTSEENVQKIANAERDLQDLSIKLRSLSSQFKLIEERLEEEEDW